MVVASIRNFHFKFEVIPFIFVVTMKKKLHFFRFRGPFWAFLGTPQQPHHHDSCFTSLSHLEVYSTMNLNTWPPFKYKILAKNTQKQPFFGVFLGPFLNAPAQGSKKVTVGFPRFFYTRLTFFQPPYLIFFLRLEIMQLAQLVQVTVGNVVGNENAHWQ